MPSEPALGNTDSNDIKLADVDHDGDLDIFIAQGTASIEGRQNRLLINNGFGRFTEETDTRLPLSSATSTHVDFGDVDGDLDAIVAVAGPEQLLLNDGAGVFVDASRSHLPPPSPVLQDITLEVAFLDVDGDHDLDFVAVNEVPIPGFVGAQNRLYINDGAGHFADETASRMPRILDQSTGVAYGDIDGDGDVDMFIVNNGEDFVLVNDGGGYYTFETAGRFPAINDQGRHAVLADVNGDGALDLFVANGQ